MMSFASSVTCFLHLAHNSTCFTSLKPGGFFVGASNFLKALIRCWSVIDWPPRKCSLSKVASAWTHSLMIGIRTPFSQRMDPQYLLVVVQRNRWHPLAIVLCCCITHCADRSIDCQPNCCEHLHSDGVSQHVNSCMS